jgi:hypothetical protein
MSADSGWIKTYRALKEWEWYQDSRMVHLFIHLILSANHTDKKWHGKTIKRGQMVTGLKAIRQETGLSFRKIRTGLERLTQTGEITRKSTNKYSIITICNYEKFQHQDSNKRQTSDKQATNKRQTNDNKQECKEYKNIKKTTRYTSHVYRLCDLLFAKILENNPKAKRPNMQTWCRDMDRLVRIDKRDPDDVEAVIIWCQQDQFWYKNILSPAKLRKQFDRLMLNMRESPRGYSFDKEAEEFLRSAKNES